VHEEIATIAMGLFLERGFEATTIDEIAAAAGISRRSFFRYFGTKEDVVLGHLAADGTVLRTALEQRPADEDAWTALLRAFLGLERTSVPRDQLLKISAMMYGTPSLRARSAEKHRQWQEELLPDVRRRLASSDDGPHPDVRARAVVAAAIACMDAAGEAWTHANGESPLGEFLIAAFTAVAPVR
jgi:AcrR family transcriptional regulator